jgi:hypothetical protein
MVQNFLIMLIVMAAGRIDIAVNCRAALLLPFALLIQVILVLVDYTIVCGASVLNHKDALFN